MTDFNPTQHIIWFLWHWRYGEGEDPVIAKGTAWDTENQQMLSVEKTQSGRVYIMGTHSRNEPPATPEEASAVYVTAHVVGGLMEEPTALKLYSRQGSKKTLAPFILPVGVPHVERVASVFRTLTPKAIRSIAGCLENIVKNREVCVALGFEITADKAEETQKTGAWNPA